MLRSFLEQLSYTFSNQTERSRTSLKNIGYSHYRKEVKILLT